MKFTSLLALLIVLCMVASSFETSLSRRRRHQRKSLSTSTQDDLADEDDGEGSSDSDSEAKIAFDTLLEECEEAGCVEACTIL